MRIKKFTAPTIKHALTEIKLELGENAVILHSKKIEPSGVMNFGNKELYEITAAVDENDNPIFSKPQVAPTPEVQVVPLEATANDWKSIEKLTELTSDMQEIKIIIHQMAEKMKYRNMPSFAPELTKLYVALLDSGISINLSREIIQEIQDEVPKSDFREYGHINALLKRKITRKMLTSRVSYSNDEHPYIIALVGPTGVGKTTTLAKMATHPEIYGSDKVAFISIDTYRIAAIEQLRTFAKIAQIPMDVAYSLNDISKAITKYRQKDIILIDTPGRSPNNKHQLLEMKEFIERARPDEVHLVLNVSTRHEDIEGIIEKYKMMNFNKIVFTKLDETISPGEIINVIDQFQKPVSFITNGQEVPEDIETGMSSNLVNLILKKISKPHDRSGRKIKNYS